MCRRSIEYLIITRKNISKRKKKEYRTENFSAGAFNASIWLFLLSTHIYTGVCFDVSQPRLSLCARFFFFICSSTNHECTNSLLYTKIFLFAYRHFFSPSLSLTLPRRMSPTNPFSLVSKST